MQRSSVSIIKVVVLGVVVGVLAGGRGRTRADFVICDPVPVDEVINGPGTTNVQGSRFSQDGLELYFSSNRSGGYGGHDIWVATRDAQDGPWRDAVNLGPTVNSSSGERYPSISPDNLELYFMRSGSGWRSTRASKDEPWGPATPYAGIYPDDFSPDGLTKYTCAPLGGGYGEYDIWASKRATTDADWGEPVNLGPNVNSPAYEYDPSISSDGLALFLIARGHWRIYMSARATTEDEWGPAVQLPPEVNGYGWVSSPEISPDGSTLYFDSGAREGFSERFWQVSIKPIVDLNGDNIVDLADLLTLIDNWGTAGTLCDIGPMPWGDGIVDEADLEVLMSYWGQEPYDPTLIAHWRLDETEGIVAYDCVGTNDGTLLGNPAWQPTGGKIGGALELDGVDDYVSTPFVLSPADGPFSLFAWVKEGMPGQVILSQKGGANWLRAGALAGALTTELVPPAGRATVAPLVSSAVITDGAWHRVGFLWDGSSRAVYVDGVEVARDTQTGLAASAGGLYVGTGSTFGPGSFWSGMIDDVRIYNRAVEP